MSPLRDLERRFAASILEDSGLSLPDIVPGRFGAARHLQVYRNNTLHGLTDALADVFPAVHRLVGEGFFAHIAERFIRQHPPRAANLHAFGSQFSAFLSTIDAARDYPYLPEVASFEWAWHEVFHESDASALPLQRLASVEPGDYDRLCFSLAPATRLIESRYPIRRLWEIREDDPPENMIVDMANGGGHWLIFRPALAVQIEDLSAADHALLTSFAAHQPLERAAAAALAADPSHDLASRLQHFVANGAISGFSIRSTPPNFMEET